MLGASPITDRTVKWKDISNQNMIPAVALSIGRSSNLGHVLLCRKCESVTGSLTQQIASATTITILTTLLPKPAIHGSQAPSILLTRTSATISPSSLQEANGISTVNLNGLYLSEANMACTFGPFDCLISSNVNPSTS